MTAIMLTLAIAQADSPIKTDEVVTFFPTAGTIEQNEVVLRQSRHELAAGVLHIDGDNHLFDSRAKLTPHDARRQRQDPDCK